MTKLWSRIGCAAALLVLLAAGCGDGKGALAKYVPSGANFVAEVDGEKLMAHPQAGKIIRLVLRENTPGRDVGQAMAEVGLKPSDLEMEYLGFGEFSPETRKGGLVIRSTGGRAGRVFESFGKSNEKKAVRAEFGGKPGLKIPGKPETCMVLVNPDLLMVRIGGDWELPFKAEGKNALAMAQAFDRNLLLAVFDPAAVIAKLGPQIPPFGKKLRTVSLSVRDRDGELVTGLAGGFTDKDAVLEAKGMLDVILMQLKMAVMPPEMKEAFQGLQFAAEGDTLKLESEMPASEFDAFLKKLEDGFEQKRVREGRLGGVRRILALCVAYADEHEGVYPAALTELKAAAGVPETGSGELFYLGKGVNAGKLERPSEVPVLFIRLPGGGVAVGYADGRVEGRSFRNIGSPSAVEVVQLIRSAAIRKQDPVWTVLLANAAMADKAGKAAQAQ